VVAQDANGRHVVLKLSKARSAECTVYEMLAQDRTLLDVNDFPGVLPPIELLPWGSDHIVIVLPRCEYNLFQIGRFSLTYARWRPMRHHFSFGTNAQLLSFICHILKVCLHFPPPHPAATWTQGLHHLHSHGIAHRVREPGRFKNISLTTTQDLSWSNTLVNFFADSVNVPRDRDLRDRFQQTDRPLYAIFDFDISVVFPRAASPRQRRLPYWRSFQGQLRGYPHDTEQGECDYDPFAWDVACLGIALCDKFQVGRSLALAVARSCRLRCST
jgi:hypothetical protein